MSTQFRPVASPVSTVGRPGLPAQRPQPAPPTRDRAPLPPTPVATSPIEGRKLFQFASAIAEFNPAVQGFVNQYYQTQQKQRAQEFATNFATMSPDEAEAYYKDTRDTIGSRYVAALDRQYGLRQAYRDYQGIKADLQAGNVDLSVTPMESVIKERMQGSLHGINSQWFTSGYTEVMSEAVPAMQSVEAVFRAEQLKTEADQNFFQLGLNVIDNAQSQMLSGSQTHEMIRDLYKQYGPGTDLNMSHARMDEIVLDMAAWAADQGYEDVVSSLLDEHRGDVPALSKTKKHTQRVDAIQRKAKARRKEMLAEAHFGTVVDWYRRAANAELGGDWWEQNKGLAQELLSPSQAAGLINTNQRVAEARAKEQATLAEEQYIKNEATMHMAATTSAVMADPAQFHNITDLEIPTSGGKVATITQKEIQANVLSSVKQGIGIGPDFSPVEEPEKAAQYVSFLSQVGSAGGGPVDREVATLMTGAWTAFGVANLSEGNVPQRVADSVAWYEQMLSAGSRGLAESYVDAQSREFLDSVLFNERTVFRGDRQGAITAAAQAVQNTDKVDETMLARPTRDELGTIVRRLRSEMGGGFMGVGSNRPDNMGYIESTISEIARGYMRRTGWGRDASYERATEVFADTHTVINGVAVNTTNVNVPQNIEELSSFVAKTFVGSGHGEVLGYDDPDDLVLLPWGRGEETVWALHHKETMVPPSTIWNPVEVKTPSGTVTMNAGIFSQEEFEKLQDGLRSSVLDEVERRRQSSREGVNKGVGAAADDVATTLGYDRFIGRQGEGKPFIGIGQYQPPGQLFREHARQIIGAIPQGADKQALSGVSETINKQTDMLRAGSHDTTVNWASGQDTATLENVLSELQQNSNKTEDEKRIADIIFQELMRR